MLSQKSDRSLSRKKSFPSCNLWICQCQDNFLGEHDFLFSAHVGSADSLVFLLGNIWAAGLRQVFDAKYLSYECLSYHSQSVLREQKTEKLYVSVLSPKTKQNACVLFHLVLFPASEPLINNPWHWVMPTFPSSPSWCKAHLKKNSILFTNKQ